MTAAVVLLSVSVAVLTWAGRELLRRVRRLEIAVARMRRELELALPPRPPGGGPFRSLPVGADVVAFSKLVERIAGEMGHVERPDPTRVPGDGAPRSERAGVHEDGTPALPYGPKWGLG